MHADDDAVMDPLWLLAGLALGVVAGWVIGNFVLGLVFGVPCGIMAGVLGRNRRLRRVAVERDAEQRRAR